MQEHDPPAGQHTVEDSHRAFGAFEAKLEESSTHRTSMRHAKIRSVHFHPLGVSDEARYEAGLETMQRSFDSSVGEYDRPSHPSTIAYLLY
jgi:hypothetical protein